LLLLDTDRSLQEHFYVQYMADRLLNGQADQGLSCQKHSYQMLNETYTRTRGT